MPPTSTRSSRGSAWLLTVVVGLVALALAGAAVYLWMAGAGMASLPAALATPRPAQRAARPIPVRDPKATAAELLQLAPELTPASAELLVGEVPNATGPGLADMGLVVATRGFGGMEQAELDEMAVIIEECYAALPPADHAWMGDYMRMLRDGSLSVADGTRGRRLLSTGVGALAVSRRERLQALMEKAIRAGLAARHEAEAHTQEALLAARSGYPPRPATAAPPTGGPVTVVVPGPGSRGGGSTTAGFDNRGEAYWRGRMQAARGRVTQLKTQVAALEREVSQHANGAMEPTCPNLVTSDPARAAEQQRCHQAKQNWPQTWRADQQKRTASLERLRADQAAAERAVGELEDEARRAGALPGWLRE